jgi:hypothetical protein
MPGGANLSLAHVQSLMAEIGSLADLMAVAEHEGEDVWSLRVDEDTILFADPDRERGCLVLWGDVGTPQPGDRARLYDLLLRYGFHWDETGGVRMAVEGQDGPVIQLVDIPLAGLDGQKLQALVRGFAAKLHAWRAILGGGAGGDGAAPDWSGPDGSFMIRG